MSSLNMESITIPPDLEAEMTPAVRAFVKMLLDRMGKLETAWKNSNADGRRRKTPRCRPVRSIRTPGRSRRNASRRRNVAGSPATRNTSDLDSHRPMGRCATAETGRMPTLRSEALGIRPGTAAASGLGIARDPAAGDRVPASSADVPLLRRDDMRDCPSACRTGSRDRD